MKCDRHKRTHVTHPNGLLNRLALSNLLASSALDLNILFPTVSLGSFWHLVAIPTAFGDYLVGHECGAKSVTRNFRVTPRRCDPKSLKCDPKSLRCDPTFLGGAPKSPRCDPKGAPEGDPEGDPERKSHAPKKCDPKNRN